MKKNLFVLIFMAGALVAMVLTSGWLMQGCAGKLPPIPAMVLTATPTP